MRYLLLIHNVNLGLTKKRIHVRTCLIKFFLLYSPNLDKVMDSQQIYEPSRNKKVCLAYSQSLLFWNAS